MELNNNNCHSNKSTNTNHYMYKFVKVIVILAAFFEFSETEAKVVSGHLITHEKWKFLERFCFLSYHGTFQYEIEYDSAPGIVSLLMYPDLQWSNAYKNPKARTCEQKHNAILEDKNQEIVLNTNIKDDGCERIFQPKFVNPVANNSTRIHTTRLLCRSSRSFRSARERWWFIAVSSCNNTKGLDVRYKFRMTNGYHGDYWYEHFSADEFYILPILTGFCFVYLFLLFSALLFAVELKCRQLLHVTYKLFLTSLAFQNIGVICLCIAYGRFASNGTGLPNLKLFGRMMEGLSEFIFILLLLLLAKGFTVTRGRLRLASAVKLTLFNSCYVVVYGFLFFFEQYVFDSGLVLYIYESPAGYGILVLRLVGWFMFVYAIFFTLKHYPEKSSFYLPFFSIYSLWFISGPVVILISNHVIDKWVREKCSISIQHLCMFIGHIIFLGLTRPSAANKSFPYHVRTTQVGADSGLTLADSIDHFDAHSYAPSHVDMNGRTVDIFTVTGVVQRTHGLINPGLDIFSATGASSISNSNSTNGNGLALPVMVSLPPPKYVDAFPHETPGQVEDMLKEPDESDYDNEDEDTDGDDGVGRRRRSPTRRTRESVYAVDN